MEIKNELFKKAYEGDYYTILGCGGDLEDWKKGYEEMLEREGIGKPESWHKFTGKEYNEEFQTTGTNRYRDDLICLCFPLNSLNEGRLALFRLRTEDRWFRDMVDNDLRREGRLL